LARDADGPLKVRREPTFITNVVEDALDTDFRSWWNLWSRLKAKMALIRETGSERDLGQAESGVCPQEVLRSFNAAYDYKLVRRQPGGPP